MFNPGERVMESTAPGHVLLAAAVHRVAGRHRLPSVMSGVGVLAWMAQALALLVLLTPAFGEGAAVAVALPVALGIAGSGRWVALETNLVVALALWALVAALRSRLILAGVLAGLAALTRPDAALWTAVLLARLVARARRRGEGPRPVLAFAAAAGAVVAPWLVFASLYFGSVLPQSARAKFQNSAPLDYLAHTLRHPAHTLLPEVGGDLVVALAWAAAAGGCAVLVRRRRELWVLPAFFLAYALAYLVLRPFVPHVWHLYPTTLLFCVFALCPLAEALGRSRGAVRIASAGLTVALVASLAWRQRGAPESLESPYYRGRHEAYVAIADLLRQRARPDDSVLAVAYWSDVDVVDLGLLVTRRETAGLRGSRFLMFDRLYRGLFEEETRDLAYFRVQVGEFEAYLYDLETRENRAIRARQRRAAAARER